MSERRCPMCEKPFDPEQSPALPFCSTRCRLADLNRWFNPGYGLPYEPAEDVEQPEATGDEE